MSAKPFVTLGFLLLAGFGIPLCAVGAPESGQTSATRAYLDATGPTESLPPELRPAPTPVAEPAAPPLYVKPLESFVPGIAGLDPITSVAGRYELPEGSLPVEELEALTTGPKLKRIAMMEAVCQAMGANQSLKIEKLRPEVSHTGIESAKSEFDTKLNADISASRRHSSSLGPKSRDYDSTPSRRRASDSMSKGVDGSVSIGGRLATGTDYSIGLSASRGETDSTYPFFDMGANLNITQNLLKGRGCNVNLVQVRAAQNDFVISLYQLQQALINLVTDVQVSYWDNYLSMKTVLIRRGAYEVAKEQRLRTAELVRVGKVPPLDYLSAQAEESARISDVITAVAVLKARQIAFLRLLNPENMPKRWETNYLPVEDPVRPTEELHPDERVKLSMTYRPDLRQAQLDLANGELEVLRTENGLLPSLDLFGELGYAGSGDRFGDARRDLGNGDFHNWRIGLQFSYALQNRSARASYRRASFNRQISEEAIKNYQQIIQVDVRTAIVEIERTTRLIDSTEVTRRLRQEELASEIEKFRVGRSTQLLVAQAQRDLTSAQLDEVSAVVSNIKAYIQLYRSEGTSLQRLGIQPVKINANSGVDRY